MALNAVVQLNHTALYAIETFGLGAGRQSFEVAVRTRDVAVGAGSDVDDDLSALRHGYDFSIWRTAKNILLAQPSNDSVDRGRSEHYETRFAASGRIVC